MKKISLIIFLLNICILSGCTNQSNEELVPPQDKSYTPVIHNTDYVIKQDVTPSAELKLSLLDYEETGYRISQSEWNRINGQYMLTVDKVWVKAGDEIKAGELLISFSSKELDDKLKSYEDKKAEDLLAIDHYNRLAGIDTSYDYKSDIELLNQDITIADAYISDINSLYDEINIKATSDGIVSFVSPYLSDGYIITGEVLIKASSNSKEYVCETTEDLGLNVGDVFNVENDMTAYELCIKDIVFDEAKTKIYFEPLPGSESVLSEKNLTLIIKKQEIKGALCVKSQAVFEEDGHYFAYRYKEDGLREAVEVTIGDYVDDYVVITSGLSEDDEVELWD